MFKKIVIALLGAAIATTFAPVTTAQAAKTTASYKKLLRGAKSYSQLLRVLKKLPANASASLVAKIASRAAKANPKAAAKIYAVAVTKTTDSGALAALGSKLEKIASSKGAGSSVVAKIEQIKAAETASPTPKPYGA